jgi:hypothetical protein
MAHSLLRLTPASTPIFTFKNSFCAKVKEDILHAKVVVLQQHHGSPRSSSAVVGSRERRDKERGGRRRAPSPRRSRRRKGPASAEEGLRRAGELERRRHRRRVPASGSEWRKVAAVLPSAQIHAAPRRVPTPQDWEEIRRRVELEIRHPPGS